MTREQIATMIGSIGLPFAFDHFEEDDAARPQGPPFICFLLPERNDFHADGLNYVKISELDIELYTDEPDFDLEAAVEAALAAADLPFTRSDAVYIESEQMYQTTYITEVLLTDG